MGRRFAFTTQIWTPGASCGTTLRQTFSRSRLGERGVTTSCRKAKIQEAAPCAGHSPKSNQTRFTGRLNVRQMKRIGAAKSISARAGLVDRASILEQQPKPAAEALNSRPCVDVPRVATSRPAV